MPDQTIVCKDCRQEFTFTEGEQAFFVQKAYQPPKRCKRCRQAKKTAQAQQREREMDQP